MRARFGNTNRKATLLSRIIPMLIAGLVITAGCAPENADQRGLRSGLDAGAARKFGMESGHPPVIAASRRFFGAGDRRTYHDGVSAAGDRLSDVAAGPHAAVRYDLDVFAGLVQMTSPGGGGVGYCRRLRHP